jgi:hypothetical protein
MSIGLRRREWLRAVSRRSEIISHQSRAAMKRETGERNSNQTTHIENHRIEMQKKSSFMKAIAPS